jgi:cob(I)alamin adenosyltransferase
MLYTRKGDGGTTKSFGCDQRFSKSAALAEALGSVDEINSLLGLCKIKATEIQMTVANQAIGEAIEEIQQTLFIIQAELAGADKRVPEERIKFLEKITDAIEQELPPITTFFVSGGTELAALFDYARTVARRAERRVVAVAEVGDVKLGNYTLPFMNRLSSVLYACARLANMKAGIVEQTPRY